jgi:hypothetical protein
MILFVFLILLLSDNVGRVAKSNAPNELRLTAHELPDGMNCAAHMNCSAEHQSAIPIMCEAQIRSRSEKS